MLAAQLLDRHPSFRFIENRCFIRELLLIVSQCLLNS